MPWQPRQYQPRPRYREPHKHTTRERGYGYDWQLFRKQILSLCPLCADCEEQGLAIPACELHHIIKIRQVPERRLDVTNVRALCGPCHDRRTAGGE